MWADLTLSKLMHCDSRRLYARERRSIYVSCMRGLLCGSQGLCVLGLQDEVGGMERDRSVNVQ
jgi:hypothetical protein